ncbi:MAG: PhaM family polyhydroxyalkanoate granule multifunctional regulatory protein [Rubrivivax sp.]
MTPPDFTKMVPGFDFLQGLLKGAGSSLPSMSQWIAPTLDADEVDKRIRELRTVQFWLEQNAKMLGATIQALEVQRMTLATLKTMNLPMNELRESMKLDPAAFMPRMGDKPAAPAPEPSPAPAAAPAPAPRARARKAKAATAAAAPAGAGVVDPVQWWGALTRQFTELAANAMKDTPVEAATQMAGAALKQAVQPMAGAAQAARSVAKAAAGKVTGTPRKAAARRSR